MTDATALREEPGHQRKVADHFATLAENGEGSEENDRAMLALLDSSTTCSLSKTPMEKGANITPGISAQYTYQYRCLNVTTKWCFNCLYNDFYYRRNNDFWYGKAMGRCCRSSTPPTCSCVPKTSA